MTVLTWQRYTLLLGFDSGPACSGRQFGNAESVKFKIVSYCIEQNMPWNICIIKHVWLCCRSRRSWVSRLLIQRTLSLTWHVPWSKMALLWPRRSKHNLGQEVFQSSQWCKCSPGHVCCTNVLFFWQLDQLMNLQSVIVFRKHNNTNLYMCWKFYNILQLLAVCIRNSQGNSSLPGDANLLVTNTTVHYRTTLVLSRLQICMLPSLCSKCCDHLTSIDQTTIHSFKLACLTAYYTWVQCWHINGKRTCRVSPCTACLYRSSHSVCQGRCAVWNCEQSLMPYGHLQMKACT